ncbi:MAG: DUF2059 domain-containing protein [Chthoniobacterales bacterium]
MKRILLALVLLNFIPLARAADDKAVGGSHYKAAEEMLTILDTPNLLKQSIDQMVTIQVQQSPAMAPFEGIMRQFFAKYMSWESLKPDLIQLYMDEFSETELNDINKFYQTPAGKKMVGKLPSLMAKGAQLGARRMQEHMPELQAAVEAQAKKGATGSPATPVAPPAKK